MGSTRTRSTLKRNSVTTKAAKPRARKEASTGDVTEHEMRFEIHGLITLLAKNLYADPDVFLREMIQNAHDSIIKRRELAVGGERGEAADKLEPGVIRIDSDRAAGTLTIVDNGAGLTEQEIHDFLSTIGRSGTRELREMLEERDRERTIRLIGMFGIGILSAFIVAERVEITTRSAIGPGFLWKCEGGKSYSVQPARREQVGTSVVLHLRNEHSRYLDMERLRSIVRRYADFLGVPVFVGGDTANAVNAPWHRAYSNAGESRKVHHEYWERRFTKENSLDILPLDELVSGPETKAKRAPRKIRICGVLGITDRHIPGVDSRGTVEIYVSRMFVTSGNREVLPSWARFIQGVIECDALTPNAARDGVVRNETLDIVRRALGQTILSWLSRLSRDAPKKFDEIVGWHSFSILSMAVEEGDEHREFFRAIADLIPIESDQGRITIPAYLESAATISGRRVVHYITESGAANQWFVLCRARGIRVLNASEPFAERFLQLYAEIWPERLRLSRLDLVGSDVIFEPIPDDFPERDRHLNLEAAYARIFPDLRCIAKVSRFRPAEMPAVLTDSHEHLAIGQIESVMVNPALPQVIKELLSSMIRDKREPLLLHLNADNPTVQRLAKREMLGDQVAQSALIALYNNAFLLLSRTMTPDNVQIIFQQFNSVIDHMLTFSEERAFLERENAGLKSRINELENQTARPQLDRCITCFVAMPFRDAGDALFSALREVLEDVPFIWKVTRADKEVRRPALWDSVRDHMQAAHCFIADVSDQNPNVLIEVGRMDPLGRSVLLLKKKGSSELPSDLRGRVYASYDGEGKKLVRQLREELQKHPDFVRQKGERALTETVLRNSDPEGTTLTDAAVRRIARAFEACFDFINAEPDEASRRLRIQPEIVVAAQRLLKARMDGVA